ncbi:MAG: hypothetical protein J0I77_04460 [Rudaea sp.]|uniref:hypothetical protein n=1 Tax=unclassified Rudaea TaxID=2627037 RepID=UPI0010FA1B43|nr:MULTISPECIES: hypothetical protein [unclassified Rudaea]MBN8884946.1 hypothetical protein [Rudaea sp.]MBR0344477.1 hypothetical protein [Rudaea sp.]
MNPFLLIFGLATAIAVVLIGISLLLTRLLLQRSAPRSLIRIKPFGILLCIAQFLIAFAVIAWGRSHLDSALGHVVATDLGAVAMIIAAGIFGCIVSAFLQRRGIALYYRAQSGG